MRWVIIICAVMCLTSVVNSGEIIDTDKLNAWYNGYNEKYFQKELPEAGSVSPPDVVITFNLHDADKAGITIFGAQDGFIHMGLNPDFLKGTKTLRLTMLHEQCHIRMFVENAHEFDQHGPKWQACMHHLADEGAFEDLW